MRQAVFGLHWLAAGRKDLVRGASQFLLPLQNREKNLEAAEKQADAYIRVVKRVKGFNKGNLPPVLDLEQTSGPEAPSDTATNLGAVSPDIIIEGALAWLKKVETAAGKKPIVMLSSEMIAHLGDKTALLKDYPLWIQETGKDPSTDCPTLPAGFEDWQFWSYQSRGRVGQVSTPLVLSAFHGTERELRRLIGEPEPSDAGVDGASMADAAPQDAGAATEAEAGTLGTSSVDAGPEREKVVGTSEQGDTEYDQLVSQKQKENKRTTSPKQPCER